MIQPHDPKTNTRKPFPNQLIPENRLDPVALTAAALYPLPNRPVQFRAEFFNATNTPHFGAPGSTVGTGQFGVISSAGAARIIQFGLKINF